MKSWKTTVAGLLALTGGALVQFFPAHAALGGFLATLGSGAGLLFARDNKVTSEQAGAGVKRAKEDSRQGKLTMILAVCLGLVLCGQGCATFGDPGTSQRLASAAKVAAYVGTVEYLRAHPETRPAFELARDTLKTIEASEHVDLATLLAVVNQLPIKELKSERATLIVTSATILITDFAGTLPVDRLDELKPVASAIRQGIDLGLGPYSAVPAASVAPK
jgi:hypothetical protein